MAPLAPHLYYGSGTPYATIAPARISHRRCAALRCGALRSGREPWWGLAPTSSLPALLLEHCRRTDSHMAPRTGPGPRIGRRRAAAGGVRLPGQQGGGAQRCGRQASHRTGPDTAPAPAGKPTPPLLMMCVDCLPVAMVQSEPSKASSWNCLHSITSLIHW